MPDFETTFALAAGVVKENAARSLIHGPRGLLDENAANPSIVMAVGQSAAQGGDNACGDVDRLILDPSSLESSVKQWENIAGNKLAKEPDDTTIYQILSTRLQELDHDPFLDTPDGRSKLNILARTCMKTYNGKRWLSGDDIVLAMKSVRDKKGMGLMRTDYFEEVNLSHLRSLSSKLTWNKITSRDGQKVLMPCGPKASATKRRPEDLSPDERLRSRLTPVTLRDLEVALANIRTTL